MLIAARLHWSRKEILSLPSSEFAFFVRKLIDHNKPDGKL